MALQLWQKRVIPQPPCNGNQRISQWGGIRQTARAPARRQFIAAAFFSPTSTVCACCKGNTTDARPREGGDVLRQEHSRSPRRRLVSADGRDAASSGALQFKEFVLYELEGGQLYTLSQPGGHPGGAFADPSLVIPKHGDRVLLACAKGLVVGETGKYRTARGPYSTRLKLETIGGLFALRRAVFPLSRGGRRVARAA